MKVDSIVIYRSFIAALRKIKDPVERCAAYDAMFDYGLDHEDTDLEGGAGIAFELIKPLLDAQYQRKMINRENGKKGGRPKSEEQEEKTETKPKITEEKQSESLISNGNGNVNVNGNGNNKRFIKPTIEQITSYINEKQLSVDPERFLLYYESNGWRVGRNPMKDWRAALQNWSRNNKAKPIEDARQTYNPGLNKKLSDKELNELLELRRA